MASDAKERRRVVLSVFWCGTDGHKELSSTQLQLFGKWCDATDISEVEGPLEWDEESSDDVHLKLRFDGCYITNGLLGMVFGAGLDAQSKHAYSRVMEIIEKRGARLVLNLFGLSRGAVGCLKLIKKLKAVKEHLEVNVLAFDPVPGNFVTTAKMDIFHVTHAWSNMDLRATTCVKDALVLFPYEPLPDHIVHAPMIPRFAHGVAIYEVILGCHQGAMWNVGPAGPHDLTNDLWISAEITKNFLASHGTLLSMTVDTYFPHNEALLLARLQDESMSSKKSKRSSHSKGGIEILRRTGKTHLNRLHYILQKRQENLFTDHSEVPDVLKPWREQPYFYSMQIPEDLEFNLCLSAQP
jgi:hypothetical protein